MRCLEKGDGVRGTGQWEWQLTRSDGNTIKLHCNFSMGLNMKAVLSEKLACAYFFAAPALAYGLFTSRLPAIKDLAALDNAATGSILMSLGLSTLVGLLASPRVILRYGARAVTGITAGCLCFGLILACLSINFLQILCCCAFTGFAVGLCDVGANALGIELENRHKSLSLSFLHGISSVGGVVGALSGALFAWLEIGPFFNSLLVLGVFCLFWPVAYRRVVNVGHVNQNGVKLNWFKIPLFVAILGILSFLAHIAEGAAAEWGSILLHSIKHAPEDEAALAFACFTGGMVLCRLCGDKLRTIIGDLYISVGGALLGAFGMGLALLSPWTILCLFAYLLMGIGLALIVPILFSRAGRYSGLDAGRASAIISTFSYTGLLLFPPVLGYLAQGVGLTNALWVVVIACVLVACGSFIMKGQHAEGEK